MYRSTASDDAVACTKQTQLESDWELANQHQRYAVEQGHLSALTISYPTFEAWWKQRLGVDTPDIPVLPEFMVQIADEVVVLEMKKKHVDAVRTILPKSVSSFWPSFWMNDAQCMACVKQL